MRIWDISPGYLNRQSLLGEHRELHGIVSIILNNKKGYSRHPETVRWLGYSWALKQRHQQLAAEMSLRGFNEKSPVTTHTGKAAWPRIYIDEPYQQFQILAVKYLDKEQGRIPLPRNVQELWKHHKYSVLARDVGLYREIGRGVSKMNPYQDFSEYAKVVTEQLRKPPSIGTLRNALQHMWGYVSDHPPETKDKFESWSLTTLLKEIQIRAVKSGDPYLTTSTALSELSAWLPDEP